MTQTERTSNMIPALIAKSNAGDSADVIVWADPATHRLLVNASVAISSGSLTQNNAAPAASSQLGVLPAVASAAAPTYTEGFQVLLSTDLTGALRVSSSSFGDNSAFTAGTTSGQPIFGFYHSTVDTVTDGRAAAIAITSKRAIYASLFDASGNAMLGSKASASSIPVVIASDQASIPVAATLTAETTKVIGVVRVADGSGNLITSTGNAVDVNIKTVAALTFTVAGAKTNNNAAPGATNVGALIGVANAAIPTWVEGNEVLASMDLAGNMRVIQPDVVVAATNITTQNLNPFSGAATANSTVSTAVLNNPGTISVQITGDYRGALTLQGTVDGTNWITLGGMNNVATGLWMSTLPASFVGIFQMDPSGFSKIRVSALGSISGTAVVTIDTSTGSGMVGIDTAIILDPSTAPSLQNNNGLREANTVDMSGNVLLTQILDQITQLNLLQQGFMQNMKRQLDEMGREVVTVGNSNDKIKTVTLTLSASTAETTLIPGTSSSSDNRLLALVVSNTSAATSSRVDIRDYTGGPVLFSLQSVGGGSPTGFSLGGVAIPQNTRGGNWTAQCGTSTTDIRILAVYSVN